MKGVEGWGAQRSDFIFRLKTTQGEINNHEPEPAKTKRKVLYLGLAEKRFFSLVTILTSNAKARNANPLRTSLALGFHFFSTEKRKGGPLCVSANSQGRTKKKSLFLNFQRTEITQRKQKQGWTEIILKLNIRFFFLDIKKIWEFQKFSEFPMTKQRPHGLWIWKMLSAALIPSCIFFQEFCSRKRARLEHSENINQSPLSSKPNPSLLQPNTLSVPTYA